MSTNITFTMIKPTAVINGNTGEITDMILKAGFKIKAMKFLKLSTQNAEEFYAVHKERPFFSDLVKYMTSGPIFAIMLEKENAVEDYRKFIGATDPSKAEAGTIRSKFGVSLQQNAVHGSDSDANAEIECNFFFSTLERF